MNGDVPERALAELTQLEAAAFRFGHQVRALLAAFPTDMPAPFAVMPRFVNGTDANGDAVMGARSYLHLVVSTEADVREWASRMQSPVERKVIDEEEYGNVSAWTDGDMDGLRVHVGSSESYTREQWEQRQKDAADVGGDAA